MKTMNNLLFTAAIAATLTVVNASAQYRVTGDDGITASPKVRQLLDQRKAAPVPTLWVPVVTVTSASPTAITASPKVQQMLAERTVVVSSAPYAEVAMVGYEANPPDGIAASPKVRQQMAQRTPEFIIAPLK